MIKKFCIAVTIALGSQNVACMESNNRWNGMLKHDDRRGLLALIEKDRETAILAGEAKVSQSKLWIGALAVDAYKNQAATSNLMQNTVAIWSIPTLQKQSFSLETDFGLWIKFYNEGSHLAAVGVTNPAILSYDIKSEKLVSRLEVGKNSLARLATTNASSLVASTDTEQKIYLCDLAQQKVATTFSMPPNSYSLALAISNDERFIADAPQQEDYIYVWDTQQPSQPFSRIESNPDHFMYSLAFNHDHSLLAGGGEDHDGSGKTTYPVRVWDVNTGNILHTFNDATKYIMQVKFSDDGRYLIGGSQDNKVRVYDMKNNEKVTEINFPVTPYVEFNTTTHEAVSLENDELKVATFFGKNIDDEGPDCYLS